MDVRPTNAIEYAPPLPRHRRLARRWALPVAVLALLASAYWWGPPVWYRAQLTYFEWRCARHVAPPETIVYSEYPDDVKQLVASNPAYQPGPADTGSVFLVPDAWSNFYNLLSPPGFRSSGTVFLHERRTPAAGRRLVSVDYLGDVFHDSVVHTARFQVRVFERGSAFTLPVEVQTKQFNLVLYPSDGISAPLRLRAGQPDASDPAHFTIAWELPGEQTVAGVIDGWLRESGVTLEPRTLTPPPPPSPE